MSTVKCQRCGQEFPSPSCMGSHLPSCLRIPKPDDLAQMMDDDPMATPSSLAEFFGVHYRTIKVRLQGTHWTRERLQERAAHVRRENGLRDAIWRPTSPYCPRCYLLNGTYDLCKYCHQEIEAKVARGATMRAWDMPYLAGVTV